MSPIVALCICFVSKIDFRGIALFGLDNKVNDSDVSWGISKKVLLPVDGKLIPLATAHPRIFKELSNE